MDAKSISELAGSVGSLLHLHEHARAAQQVAAAFEIPKLRIEKNAEPAKYLPVLQNFLHQLLERGFHAEAAQMLWTKNQFTPEPISVKQVWQLFEDADMGLIMGAAKMGKSFSMGVKLFLEWVRDPQWTSIRVLGPSENHLEENLFSHLVGLHNQATLPMPGEVGGLFIGLNRRDQLSSIRGVVVPKGNSKKAGRLQGGHRRPRPAPHPVFGPLSRMFIFIDEIENVPDGIWMDIDNVLSEIEKGVRGFKIFGAYNPTDPASKVAQRAEPPFGWSDLDEEKHFRWKSTRGWDVLRLDGEKCENVTQGRIIFPGLQTRDGLEFIAANGGGVNSPGYRTMGRGLYPSLGMEATVIPSGMFAKWRGEYIWYQEPQPVGSTDLALEGGDAAIYGLGKWGLASGIKWPPSIEFPQGRTVMFKNPQGQVTPRYGLQADELFTLPKGETVSMKNSVVDMNRKAGTRPEFYACDRTGHGAGVADLIKFEWSGAIHDVNYSQSAGEEKIMAEDSKSCNEQYERMYSVLWFAMRQWGEFQYFLINPKMDLSKVTQQVTQRRFRVLSGKTKVESKKDYESRGFGSPNEADALTLLVHAARKGSGAILSMRGDMVEGPHNFEDDDWPMAQNGARIDPSNTTQFLDETTRPGESLEGMF